MNTFAKYSLVALSRVKYAHVFAQAANNLHLFNLAILCHDLNVFLMNHLLLLHLRGAQVFKSAKDYMNVLAACPLGLLLVLIIKTPFFYQSINLMMILIFFSLVKELIFVRIFKFLILQYLKALDALFFP